MSEHRQKPFRVEVAIDAPRDAVWRALTDPAEIRRWFGWDYATLDDEIRFIFVDHAEQRPPDRIDLGGGQTIELAIDGPRTLVRIVCAGPADDADWDDVYDAIEEGWRAFFHQLRHYLERHPGEERRTIFLGGEAAGADAARLVDATVPGRAWMASRFQRATAVDAYGGGLVGVASTRPVDGDEAGRLMVTITTHGMDDAAFAALHAEWAARWTALARNAKVTVAG